MLLVKHKMLNVENIEMPESRKECVEVKEQLATRKDVNCQEDEQNILKNSTADGGYPPLCEEDLQPRKKRAAQFNLRKSLAWDQAFFTSEGTTLYITLV